MWEGIGEGCGELGRRIDLAGRCGAVKSKQEASLQCRCSVERVVEWSAVGRAESLNVGVQYVHTTSCCVFSSLHGELNRRFEITLPMNLDSITFIDCLLSRSGHRGTAERQPLRS